MTSGLRGVYLEYNSASISGKTALYGVIGDPVDHSLSPAIQNAAFQAQGLDAVYVPFHVKPGTLKSAIQGLRALGVRGFNVTLPHKIPVMRFLDELDRKASEMGSVNTVANRNGILYGYSTDGLGALKALGEAGVGIDGKTVLLLGAGGSARALAYAFAPQVKSMRIINRTFSRAKQLERRLRAKFPKDIASAQLSRKSLSRYIEEADVIVNASSMGMDGKADPPITEKSLRASQCVFELVYRPQETRLLREAKLAGARTVNGLDQLVHQAACSFELWFGRQAPLHEMRRAIARKLPLMAHAESS